ncbi:AAA family ATPase [Priestia filamentosa]|uniref:AAA family ATPase n=1 Tax=Priestia filamentosa TaxID=1402861 RepID=UPI00058923EE
MPKLIIFTGPAGTGKSTLSKKLLQHIPAVYLDKDTVGGRASEKILDMSGMDTKDRDSDFYKKHCRDLEYQSTMDVALENLELGLHTFLIGPFTKELADKNWIDTELGRVGLTKEEIDVKVVIVTVDNQEVQKERIKERQTERDTWKLNHWEEFTNGLKDIEVNWDISKESIIRFDNSEELTEERVNSLLKMLN